MKDYYKILQVDCSAEPEIIAAAYKRLALKYHPDTSKLPDATRRMREINEAYEILRAPEKRRQYDRLRAKGGEEARTETQRTETEWQRRVPWSWPLADEQEAVRWLRSKVPEAARLVEKSPDKAALWARMKRGAILYSQKAVEVLDAGEGSDFEHFIVRGATDTYRVRAAFDVDGMVYFTFCPCMDFCGYRGSPVPTAPRMSNNFAMCMHLFACWLTHWKGRAK